jgi:WD40 repeat protein
VRSTKLRTALNGHTDSIYCVAPAGAGKLLASASQDGTVRLWDTAKQEQRLVLKLGNPVWCVAFSSDGKLLAAGDDKGTIRLWSVPRLLASKGKKEGRQR